MFIQRWRYPNVCHLEISWFCHFDLLFSITVQMRPLRAMYYINT